MEKRYTAAAVFIRSRIWLKSALLSKTHMIFHTQQNDQRECSTILLNVFETSKDIADIVIDLMSISNEYIITMYLSDTCNARPVLLLLFF